MYFSNFAFFFFCCKLRSSKAPKKLGNGDWTLVAEGAVKSTTRPVLEGVNRGAAPTLALGPFSVPKLKSGMGGAGLRQGSGQMVCLESFRQRQCFGLMTRTDNGCTCAVC